MNQLRQPRILPLLLPALLTFAFLAGCAAKKNVWGDPATGVTLTYRMPEDRTLRYETAIDQSQKMEVRGQSREFSFGRTFEYSVRAEGPDEEGQQLEITIDALTVRMEGPRGEGRSLVKEVEGKTLGLFLAGTGEETALSGASAISYDLPSGVRQSVEADFRALFPDLPAAPVVAGDSWESTEWIVDEALGSPAPFELRYVHTVAGFEVVDGMDCVKISSTISADLEDRAGAPDDAPRPAQPFAGGLVGTATWYFAYEEGLLVRKSVMRRASGTLSTGAINPLPRRLMHQTAIETRLLK